MIQMPCVLCERFTEALWYAVVWDTIEAHRCSTEALLPVDVQARS